MGLVTTGNSGRMPGELDEEGQEKQPEKPASAIRVQPPKSTIITTGNEQNRVKPGNVRAH